MDDHDHERSAGEGPLSLRPSQLAELRKTLVIPEPIIPPPPPIPGGGPPSSVGRRPTLPSVGPSPRPAPVLVPVTDSHAPMSVDLADEEPISLPVERPRWPKWLLVAIALGGVAIAGHQLRPRHASQTAVASLAPRVELAIERALAKHGPEPERDARPETPRTVEVESPERSRPQRPAPAPSSPSRGSAPVGDDPIDGDLVNPYVAPE